MLRKLVIANWKMHGSLAFVRDYAQALAKVDGFDRLQQQVDVAVLPPVGYLSAWNEQAPFVLSGAQDIGISPHGAHTGEMAAEMIRDLGGTWTLAGHSERRIDKGETDDLVATKAAAALRGGLRPIVCVGETLAERQAGHEIAVVERQLEAVLDRLEVAQLKIGAIAYEPVWAIGTGETATAEQAQDMHAFMREKLTHASGEHAAGVRLLYGGSVKPENAAELFAQRDIDGGLIGGAGLEVASFVAVIEAAAAATDAAGS